MHKNFSEKINVKNQKLIATEMPKFIDPAAERIVLCGLLKYGSNFYNRISTFLPAESFASIDNEIIYRAIISLIMDDNVEVPTTAGVMQKVQGHKFSIDVQDYIEAITSQDATLQEALANAKVVGREAIRRKAYQAIIESANNLAISSNQVPIQEVLSSIEGPILNLQNSLTGVQDSFQLSSKIDDFFEKLCSGELKLTGIPTGFPIYDKFIGHGVRPGIHGIAARAKGGKSFMSINMGLNIAKSGIPVIYLDTELDENTTLTRIMANLSNVAIDDIESAKFIHNDFQRNNLNRAKTQLKNLNFTYQNISGKSHGAWIASVRKWIHQVVGYEKNGKAKPCVILLDYLKTMDLREMGNHREDQYIGQVMTDLQSLVVQYSVPIITMLQQNREGLSLADERAVATSDRIAWFCSSLSLIQKKGDEDIADCGLEHGDRKLLVLLSRFGSGSETSQYINLKANLGYGKISEGQLNTSIRKSKPDNDQTGGSGRSTGDSQ